MRVIGTPPKRRNIQSLCNAGAFNTLRFSCLSLTLRANSFALKKTPLYDLHVKLGAKMVPFAGYEMPIRYSGDTQEHLAVRQKAGLFEVSHMGEFLVRGPQALALIQSITTNDVSKVEVGKAQYNCLPNDKGGIVDDIIVYRLEEQLYMIVVNAANIEKDWNWISSHNTVKAALQNISDATALIALSGPESVSILKKLTGEPVETIPYYAHMRATVAGLPNVLVATTGYTGERTFELFCRTEQAAGLWEALMQAGAPNGLEPVGLGARDTLRLEMGYMLYGNDITDETSPLEAGLGWITKLDKPDFTAKAHMTALKASGLKQKLVGFEMAEKGGIPRGGFTVAKNGAAIGTTTSGTFSPSLKNGIGMAYVQTSFAKEGEAIDIVIRDKGIKARIVKTPFVKDTSLSRWKGK